MGERRVTDDGRILEKMPDGTIVQVGTTQQGGGQVPGAVPLGPRRGVDVNAQRREDRADRADQRAADAQRRADEAAQRQALEWQATHNPDGSPKQVRTYRPMPDSAAQRLDDSVTGLESLNRGISSFNPDYGGNSFTGGLENTIQSRFDSFGTPGQAQWWSDMKATDNKLRNALFGASLTAGEQDAWNATTVDPSMDPAQIQANLARRRQIAEAALRRRASFLSANGYDPAAVNALLGELGPQIMGQNSQPVQQQGDRNAPPMIGAIPGQMTLRDFASPTDRPVPSGPASGLILGPEKREELDQEATDTMNKMFHSGASYEDLNNYSVSHGFGPLSREFYEQRRASDAEYLRTNGRPNNSPAYRAVRQFDQNLADRFTQGGPGAAAIGYFNSATFGGVGALAPEKMDMARQAHPIAEGVGEIAGVFSGMKGAGGALGSLGTRYAPRTLQAFRSLPAPTRNLIADAGYGAGRGVVENPDNPVLGALTGGGTAMLGSVLGQGVGTLAGRGLSGVTSSPTISRLRQMGVTPSLGQIMRGRQADNGGFSIVAGLEDVMSNSPGAGAMVNNVRRNALEQANTGVFRQVGGDTIEGTGVPALQQLENIKTSAYDDASRGVNIPANDPRFIQQVDAADTFGRLVDQSRNRGDFGFIMDNELSPILQGGKGITGRKLQDSLRLIQGQRRAFGKAANGAMPDPSAAKVADALSNVEGAFIGAAARNAPQAIPKLKAANKINRGLSILDDASSRAINNDGVFTGAQLGQALKADADKFGKRGMLGVSKSPLYQAQQDMQRVLPNQVPPTGVNLAPWIAGTGLLAGGVNEGTGLDSNALRAASLAAMLSAPYTRAGSKATAKLLLDRPENLRKLGTLIRKKQGLFGTASVPLLLEAQK